MRPDWTSWILRTPVVIWRCFLKTRVGLSANVRWPGTSMIQLYADQRQEKAWATHWLSWRQRSGWLTWQACRPTTTRCATRTPAITISPIASPKAWTAAIKHQSLLTRLQDTWCLIHPRLRKSLNRKRLKFNQLLSSTISTWQKFNENVKTHFAFYLGRLYLPTGWFINRHITVYGPSKVYFDILPQPLTQALRLRLWVNSLSQPYLLKE